MRPKYEVADVLQINKHQLSSYYSNSWQIRTLHALRKCRTADLGGHGDQCDSCGNLSLSYNSCRNRHCPKCQGEQREAWIQARENELLPVPYFHVVFTLPEQVNPLCLYAPAKVYRLLFSTAWSVMQSFAKDAKHLGAKPAMIAVLHTWGHNLSLHPHLHCIVPGGGVTRNGKWKTARNKGKFLFPVKAMSKVFRARFVAGLRREFPEQDRTSFASLFKKERVVYAKRPFQHPKSVVEYLGRYTHKIAISNHRLLNLDNGQVTFSYKDYRKGAQKLQMSLSDNEFIRRFSQHILPRGFVRIRHYGFLSSSWKSAKLPDLQRKLGLITSSDDQKEPVSHRRCCACGSGILQTKSMFYGRAPPIVWLERIAEQ
ncbi:IS91 family transposase [Catalinimonas niigatensis]|uniref:IS91 family transposase n=1 Tax=Catalinimonas niigatensis TaxID=1397264 RepID=UPI00266522E7|nr:IS91 family transposase [Catalinimonas niigatensis]WPP50280.1 IS91 family transposase [Catalinimonas niigatensis]